VSVLSTTASSLQLSGFGINCQLMLSCRLPSLDWQAARQLRRQFRDICPVFICTSARYQLQRLGCYWLSQALHAHLPCTTLLNSEDLCIIARERVCIFMSSFICGPPVHPVAFSLHHLGTVPVLVSTTATRGKQSLRRRQQRCHNVNIKVVFWM